MKERDRQFLPATFTCPRTERDRTSSYVASIQERPQRNTGLKERKKPGKLQTSTNVHFYSGGKETRFLPATLRCPTHQPTNPDAGTPSSTSVANKQPAAPHMQATKESIHIDRIGKKCSSPKTNANMTFSSQRLERLATNLLHRDPQNRSKNLLETWRP